MHSGDVAFMCIPHDSACRARAQTHSDAFRCMHHRMHSGDGAFMCIPHDSACIARASLRSGSMQVHSCAFIYIHMHLTRMHMNAIECMLNALECI